MTTVTSITKETTVSLYCVLTHVQALYNILTSGDGYYYYPTTWMSEVRHGEIRRLTLGHRGTN